ncbi:peptidylprolyl isomerase [bacterium]|nr:peptidylprolyl isomerase [bacterium]
MRNLSWVVFFLLGIALAKADFIAADFRTTKGDFTMSLDYMNSPMAVANFIQLAGKPDDILETPAGVPFLEDPAHYTQSYYRPTAQSDVQRLALRVQRIERTPTMRGFYGIFQSGTYIGGVEGIAFTNYHADITGEDRIRLQQISSNPAKYRITLRYPRTWLDARDLRVKQAPMYHALRVNRVDTGIRFFAGSMTNDPLEHPGYQFQDELVRNPNNLNNLYDFPFNQQGILAMDTLAPNRNGSRFFITSIAVPSFNGRFTAFGQVASIPGLNVVRSIANTPTDNNGVPDEEIAILDISIRREGITANAFMEGYHQNFLPGPIETLPLSIEQIGGNLELVTPLRPQTQNALFSSSDLQTFLGGGIVAQPPGRTELGRVDLGPLLEFAPKSFFKGVAATIPNWPSGEISLENAQLDLRATSGTDRGTLTMNFGVDGTSGNYLIDMFVEQNVFGEPPRVVRSFGSGTFTSTYDFSQGPYLGVLNITNYTGPLNAEQFNLHFDSSRFTNNPQVDPATFIRRFDARTIDPEIPFLSYSGLFQKIQ